MSEPVRHWAASHAGCVRPINQDAFLCRPDIGLFAVADGVGGKAGGGVASAEVVRLLDTIPHELALPERLAAVRTRLEEAQASLLADAAARGTDSAATTVVVLLLHHGFVACLWAGDSRAYVLRHGGLHQLTSDHSLVGEMVRSGTLTEAQAERHAHANVITRAIGVGGAGALVDKVIGTVEPGDRFLLCSDGLTRSLPHGDVVALMGGDDPARQLVEAAIRHKARDNVTALVATLNARPGALPLDTAQGSRSQDPFLK